MLPGGELDPVLTLKARQEETEQVNQHKVYVKVLEDVRWAVAGKAPIGSRWIDSRRGRV